MIDVATTDCTVSHSAGSTTSGGTFTITTPPSLKVSADGANVYGGPIDVSFSGGNSSFSVGGTIVPGSVMGSGTIVPTATKGLAEGNTLIREGDSAVFSTLTGTLTPPSGPAVPNTVLPFTSFEISSAGQNRVRSN